MPEAMLESCLVRKANFSCLGAGQGVGAKSDFETLFMSELMLAWPALESDSYIRSCKFHIKMSKIETIDLALSRLSR